GQKMWLVDHKQVRVGMQDALVKRDHRFHGNFAEIEDRHSDPAGRVDCQGFAPFVQYPPPGEPLAPGCFTDLRKMAAQRLQDRGPWAGTQLKSAGRKAIDGMRAVMHLPSVTACAARMTPERLHHAPFTPTGRSSPKLSIAGSFILRA